MGSKVVVAGAFMVLLISSSLAVAAEVNVYSYRQPFLIKPLFDAFTKETGIRVNTVYARKGLVQRLKNEGLNSRADLIFTVDIGRLSDAVSAEVTQEVNSDILDANIPASYRSNKSHWFGLTSRARVIAASKERVKEGEISTYEQLADPKWKGRICTRSGKHPYMVALTASMIAHHGEAKAKAWLSGLKANLARKPQGNDRAQAKAIKEGQCDLAVMNHYYMAQMMRDEKQSAWADAIFLVFPNQSDRGTHLNVSGMALTKSAPNKAHAIKLMEFLSGDLAQRMYAEENSEYPLKPGVPWSGLLASWGKFKADTVALDQVAKYRADAIKMADEVQYDAN
ncbi:Fe(3+) ABC transporter substrate-binding protein [Candidatus Entotheonella palauensis]|uniref:Iron ABC transporter substrate-binding protein n=1 Tax=Candidatus Entotheonella gemina TaxID=1429439 RepID=W4LU06_9BACT|nr:Fe(3+) ABC transporter substrate-binding protein [Candidatus Entotheonella palauensis]ETX00902.1 MAG: iron ABC transporter substrate-binding protein [Candidatus Entotheonella gemina]